MTWQCSCAAELAPSTACSTWLGPNIPDWVQIVAKISSGPLQSRRDVWSDPEVAAPHAVAGAGGGAAGGSVRSLAARALHLLQENAPQDLLLLQTFRTLSLGRLMIYPGPVAEPGRCLAAIRCHCQIGAIAAR